jgi:drug/metabolite transporter (DMT)-like permease
MLDIKTITIFLPFFGACLVGVNYALNEKAFGSINLPTYVFVYCLAGAALMLLLHFITPLKLDFSSLSQKTAARLIAISIPASFAAWMITVFTIKNISADYTAIAEISYPLFTVLFGYLLFSRKIDWSMAAGAALIITGSFILISGKLKGGG